MDALITSAFGCFMLGLVTTLHPCPLTTNISALSLILGISSTSQQKLRVIVGFCVGFVAALVSLAMVLSFSFVQIHKVSLVLQQMISAFLGPLLILAGMVLTGLISLSRFYKVKSFDRSSWLLRGSPFSSTALGFILAFAFCPATAAVFFGILVPLIVKFDQSFLFSALYGLGALLPLILVFFVVIKGSSLSRKTAWSEKIPMVAGWILIALGIYITLQQLYM